MSSGRSPGRIPWADRQRALHGAAPHLRLPFSLYTSPARGSTSLVARGSCVRGRGCGRPSAYPALGPSPGLGGGAGVAPPGQLEERVRRAGGPPPSLPPPGSAFVRALVGRQGGAGGRRRPEAGPRRTWSAMALPSRPPGAPQPGEAPHRLGALTQVGGGRSLWKPVWVTFGPNTITVAVLSRDEERMTVDGMPSGDGIAVTQPSWPFSVPRRTERLGHVSLAFTPLLSSLSVVVSRPAIDKGKVVVGVETSRRPPHFSARTLRSPGGDPGWLSSLPGWSGHIGGDLRH